MAYSKRSDEVQWHEAPVMVLLGFYPRMMVFIETPSQHTPKAAPAHRFAPSRNSSTLLLPLSASIISTITRSVLIHQHPAYWSPFEAIAAHPFDQISIDPEVAHQPHRSPANNNTNARRF
jgi:hypothetical protein